jgi:hypothetical protein
MLTRLELFTGIILAGACRMTPAAPPVPVQGGDEEISAFSGEWVGRYSSKATGRHGTIRFNLPEHADTGYGEVEITFSPSLHLSRETQSADLRAHPEELPPQPCTVVDITVVRIEGDSVRGTMVPYWDPDCECRAHTVFEGKLKRNQIIGTFSTRRESNDRSIIAGEWRAERSTP